MSEHQTNHKSIHHALYQVQWEMGPVLKTSENPYFRSKYASLETVIDTIINPLRSHGCYFSQEIQMTLNGPILRTVIRHVASETQVVSEAPIICKDPDDPQAFGGAVTYMRRYSLLTLLGIAPEDDDGNEAARPRSYQRNDGPPDDGMDYASTRGRRMANDGPPPHHDEGPPLDGGYESSKEFVSGRDRDRQPDRQPDRQQERAPARGAGGSAPFCTPRQVEFIESLWYEKGMERDEGLGELLDLYGVSRPNLLAKADASKYIERLQTRQTINGSR